MRALDPEVVDAIWAAIEPLLPPPPRTHPLGCHRPRVPDQLCFRGILLRLVTGASWVDIEAILDHQVSDTTLRTRRDEWIDAGVFDQVKVEALAAFDRIVGLDLDDVAVDGSLHKAPYGGEGTGPNPTDPAKLGWKWSVASERHGIPVGWAIDGANRNDVRMLEPLSTRSVTSACSMTSVCCTSTAATTRLRCGIGSVPSASTSSRSSAAAPSCPMSSGNRCASGCAGSSKRPTPGGPTTGSSAATPTSPPPPRRPLPRHGHPHRRPPHRLAQPLEPDLIAYPLRSLEVRPCPARSGT